MLVPYAGCPTCVELGIVEAREGLGVPVSRPVQDQVIGPASERLAGTARFGVPPPLVSMA